MILMCRQKWPARKLRPFPDAPHYDALILPLG